MKYIFLILLVVTLSSGCTSLPQQAHSTTNKEKEWKELIETVRFRKWETVLRLDKEIDTPTETWGAKFANVQAEFKKLSGVELPLFISPEIAKIETKGWKGKSYIKGPEMLYISPLKTLDLLCRLTNWKMEITDQGILVSEIKGIQQTH